MQVISIPIPGFVLNFSFAYLPVMLIGWYFGPIYGFVCGAICDTMCYLIFPGGLWYWMYAIQEPIIGLIAGLFASWCIYRQSKPKINIGVDIAIQQVVYLVFAAACYTIIVLWLTNGNLYASQVDIIYRWLSLSLITAFFILIEAYTFYNVFTNSLNKQKNITFIYTLVLVALVTLVFSFMLGPISTVSYLEYLNGTPPDNWVKYGAVYYLIPRIVVQSIKTPLEAALLTSLVLVIDPVINRMKANVNNRWE
jgi:ECF transporter S component (folate family)